MDEQTVFIESLHITKAPGFPAGMSVISAFTYPITIIAGPNGSGKSTTARTLLQVVCPDKGSDTHYNAVVSYRNERWDIRKSVGNPQWYRRGNPVEAPSFLPSPDDAQRYMLALHDLLQAEDADLAAQIYRAAIGGYNIEAASKLLGYSPSTKVGNTTEQKAAAQAQTELKELQAGQSRARELADSIELLKSRQAEAADAGKKVQFLTTLQEYQQLRDVYTQAEIRVQGYPAVLEKIHTDDADRLELLDRQEMELQSELDRTSARIDAIRAEIEAIGFPQLDDAEIRIRTLEEQAQTLRELHASQQNAGRSLQEIAAGIQKLQPLASADFTRLDYEQLTKAESLHQKLISTREQLATLRDIIQTAQQRLQTLQTPYDAQVLSRGITALTAWLREPSSGAVSGIASRWLWITGGLALLSALIVWLAGSTGFLLFLLFPVIWWLAARKSSTAADPSVIRQKDYTDLDLPQPADWTPQAVSNLLSELIVWMQAAAEADRLRIEFERSERRLSQLVQQEEDFLESYHELMGQVGLHGVHDIDAGNFFYHIKDLYTLRELQQAHAVQQEQVSIADARVKSHMEHMDALLDVFGVKPDDGGMESRLAAVRYAVRAFENLVTLREKLQNQLNQLTNLNRQIDSARKEKAQITSRLGMPDPSTEEIRRLCDQKPDWSEAQRELDRVTDTLAQTQKRLNDSPAAVFFPDWNGYDAAQTGQLIIQWQAVADTYDDLTRKIAIIESDARRYGSSTQLQSALVRADETLEKLQASYQSRLRSVLGAAIEQQVSRQVSDTSIPAVLRRARTLFSLITRGRYLLEVSPGAGAFVAVDQRSNTLLQLGELSSGTRIQLLIAVRLAFVEVKEGPARLPVFADELLANSDDIRAEAIIDALISIARTGRQLFYFTAQKDEIAKWLQKFDQEKIGFSLLKLSQDSTDALAEPPAVPIPAVQVDLPDSRLSYQEYLDQLDLPGYHLIRDSVYELPMAVLTEDVAQLHALLTRHIRTWGQLDALYDDDADWVPVQPDAMQKLRRMVDALQDAARLLSQGRSRPAGVTEIIESGAVTEAYHDQVVEVLQNECRGDPVQLLEALKSRAVPNFRRASINKLEAFFREKGYLPDGDPIPSDLLQVRLAVLADKYGLKPDVFERVLKRIT